MQFRGEDNKEYQVARELGRGGEGTVYEIAGQPGLVLKQYAELPDAEKVNKLRAMEYRATPALLAYAAWPQAVVHDDNGQPAGFVMRRLNGFLPLHMLFSPMDRKNLFPDKGYNFLVHVARNLAVAFHKLHEAGVVAGDINEGNVLINQNGLIALIDCDSFQVKDNGKIYYCEVGIPRYTPPEILKSGTFERLERTPNTDCFSLAVLIFQLLFLGRHPFAGINKTNQDYSEEKAIVEREFAYSLKKGRRVLHPPETSLHLDGFPTDMQELFSAAFETDKRPTAADWVTALEGLLTTLITCNVSKSHTYPGKLDYCPWCRFRETRGIVYFLDDTALDSGYIYAAFDTFINGFNISSLQIPDWQTPAPPHPTQLPTVSDKLVKKKKMADFLPYIIAIPLFALSMIFLSEASYLIYLFFFLFSMVRGLRNLLLAPLKKELVNMDMQCKTAYSSLHASIQARNNTEELKTYRNRLNELNRYIQDYRKIPAELLVRKTLADEEHYHQQLAGYLSQFLLDNYDIATIGSIRKAALKLQGIYSAADITKLNTVKVPGIGPQKVQLLFNWQRQMAEGFTYQPDLLFMSREYERIKAEMAYESSKLETEIRMRYQYLSGARQNLLHALSIKDRTINAQFFEHKQLELNYQEYKRLLS